MAFWETISVGDLLTLLTMGVGFTVWITRVQMRVLANERAIGRVEGTHSVCRANQDSRDDRIQRNLVAIRTTLAKICSKLDIDPDRPDDGGRE